MIALAEAAVEPTGWLQLGALGILGFIVFAAAGLLLKFAPQVIDAISGIGVALAEQMDKQDTRHREERQSLVAVITSEMGKVREELKALREDIHKAIKN